MKVRTASITYNVLAAGGEHAAGRAVDRPAHNLSKESKLSGSDHVIAYFLILNMLVLHVDDGDVKDSPHTAMKENLKTAEEVLSQGPVFASPEKEMHRDRSEE